MTLSNDMGAWISRLYENPDLRRMGHAQRAQDLNLGCGWLYYALGRMVRPKNAVVIGSYRGFVPLVIAKALQDNLEGGTVTFIDPSLADGFWSDPQQVRDHFKAHGLENIRHYKMTSQDFTKTEDYKALGEIGIIFIDSYHTEEQAEFDYNAYAPKLAPRGFVVLHDSIVVIKDGVYGAENAYEMRVKYFVDRLKADPLLQVMDFPFGHTGLSLVRKIDPDAPDPVREFIEGHPRDPV